MASDPMPDAVPGKPRKWRNALLTVAAVLAYMIPLFWLWNHIGWPESFGITITARGRAGAMENWYYSYLLLRRPNLLDDTTFLYMWAPVAGFLGWWGRKLYRDRLAKRADGQDMPS